jgi:hypothetical protein
MLAGWLAGWLTCMQPYRENFIFCRSNAAVTSSESKTDQLERDLKTSR